MLRIRSMSSRKCCSGGPRTARCSQCWESCAVTDAQSSAAPTRSARCLKAGQVQRHKVVWKQYLGVKFTDQEVGRRHFGGRRRFERLKQRYKHESQWSSPHTNTQQCGEVKACDLAGSRHKFLERAMRTESPMGLGKMSTRGDPPNLV